MQVGAHYEASHSTGNRRELDRYIVGQREAKRAVAIALRNRYRRLALPETMQAEITPKNILMIGPTGVGKTEVARRLAKLADAPFIKVEATKFTQVGYVGRDVESIIRDLMDTAISMVHDERVDEVRERAAKNAEERMIEILTEKRSATSAESSRARRRSRAADEWRRRRRDANSGNTATRARAPQCRRRRARAVTAATLAANRRKRIMPASTWPSVWRATS